VTIGSLGYFSVVVTKGINFRVGDSVKVSATANTANWFGGRIFNITTTTSSTTANITVNVHSPGNFSGSGTFSSWRVDMLFASGGGSSSYSGNPSAYESWAGVGGGGHGGMYIGSPSKWGPRSKATSHSGAGGSGGIGWLQTGNVAGTDGGSGTVVLAIPTAVSFTVPSNLSYSLDTTSRVGFNIYRFYAGNGGMSTIAADHSISPSTSPQGMAIDPFGLYLYTAIPGGSIDVRTISPVNGSLSSLGNYTTTGVTPYDLRVDVYRRSVYFNGPTGTSANIGRYTISNGTLTGTPTYVTGGGTYTSGAGYVTGICCDLSGRFVYTGNSTGSAYNIQVFQIQADGSLLSISGGISVASSLTVKTIDIDPTGRFLYAVLSAGTGASGSVLQCSINQTTGALSQIAAPVSALAGAWSLAIHPSGKFLYVIHSNVGGNGSYRFDINQTTGALTAQTNYVMGTDMTAVAFDPLGRFYYVLRSTGTLQSYRIDQFTYALSTLTSISTGTTPVAMVVHPTGDYIYISNFGSNTITQVKLDLSTVSGSVSF
jgi:6-phosphogluconolactonase (cycloisomerase 2 family)